MARRAGTTLATSATIASSAAIRASVSGSRAETSNSMFRMIDSSASEAPAPMMTPTAIRMAACPTTIRMTLPLVAPSAMRTPISCVRCVTEYDTTP